MNLQPSQNKFKSIDSILKNFTAPHVFCVLKVGKRENLEMFADGSLFCRHVTFYKKIENAKFPFYDQHDYLTSVLQASNIEMMLGTKTIPKYVVLKSETGLVDQVIVSKNVPHPCFCLHSINTGEYTNKRITEADLSDYREHLKIPNKMKEYGDWVLCILSTREELVRRLKAAAVKQNIFFIHGLVHYVNQLEIHGRVPKDYEGFVKLDQFTPEREYRFIFYSNRILPDPFVLDIGSIRDISFMTTLDDFNEKFNIQLEK